MLGNDHWTLDLKALGMENAGEALARRALTCRPPYAICVQGKWGSGKTSIMRYAMARLGGEPLANTLATTEKPTKELPKGLRDAWERHTAQSDGFIRDVTTEFLGQSEELPEVPLIVPIWFNPWQHQQAELPVIGLLHELRTHFTTLVKLRERAKKLSQVAVEAALPLLGRLADCIAVLQGGPALGTGATFANVRKVGEAYEKRNFESKEDAQRLNLLFEEAVRRLLGAALLGDDKLYATVDGQNSNDNGVTYFPLRRLVIFIDDLDRCGEDQTVHLLEAIKLYLQTPFCVFVLGMDGTAARRAVEKVLGHASEGVAREYLEKLFQATVHVPVPFGGVAFVGELLEHCGLNEERTGCSVEVMARSIVRLVEANPRKLKAFVSNLESGWRGPPDGGDPDWKGAVARLLIAYLRTVHPNVHRLLTHDPTQVLRLHEVLSEQNPQPGGSPADYFLHRSFRHAFPEVFGAKEKPTREGADVVVGELVERLDQWKGDRAFIAQWKDLFRNEREEEAVVRLFRPILSREPLPHGDSDGAEEDSA